MKDRFRDKKVVITGGSSGIGLEIAVQFARRGSHVVLIGRSEERLAQATSHILTETGVDPDRIETRAGDVADREAITALITDIGESAGGIHTLINNAGGILCGRFEDNTLDRHEERLAINYSGMLYALHAAWPYLKRSGDGHVGFVGSVAGYLGAIGYSGYAPSKFAATGLAECIRMEAAEHGLGVTIVFPPDTDTPMLEYERANTLAETKALSEGASMVSAQKVAELFVKGIEKRRFEVYCNLESVLIRKFKALLPSVFYGYIDYVVRKSRS